ncbi:MAG: ABC transporter permease subunit [Deltaproteobacteria bacterium]
MRQVMPIFKKEFRSYFVSPVAYIVISIFLIVTGWFFFSTFFLFNQASVRNFFALLPITFAFVIPAVTMRLFSEELNVGTYELLLTLPVTFKEVVLGKFLGAVAFVAAMLIPTLAYPVTVSFLGDLDWGPVIGGYLGAVLLGASFSAVGLFASSLTRNQIVAFIMGVAICFALVLIDKIVIFLPSQIIGILEYLGADSHFENISKGILDSRDILYFLSLTFLGLYATHLAMEEKS